MTEKKIREIIDCFIELYREDPNRWENERYSHYDFFGLLFDAFDPNEIKNNLKWEYPVGVPSYGKGTKEAAIDIVFSDSTGKWTAIEIELVGAGKEFHDEMIKCVQKLKTSPKCKDQMTKGYIVPLLAREADKTAKGHGKSYSDLCREGIENAEEQIGDFPIEIIKDGIILS